MLQARMPLPPTPLGCGREMPATMTLGMAAVSADLTMQAPAHFRCGRSPIQAATGAGSFPAFRIPCLAVEIAVGAFCRIKDWPCHTGFNLRAEVVDHPSCVREQIGRASCGERVDPSVKIVV